jgi:SAM-dependent methyltransferase
MNKADEKHWTERSYVENPELFLSRFEELKKQAESEVKIIKEEILDDDFDSVLDLGCGPGNHCLEFAKQGVRAHGIDISPKFIEIASSRADQNELDAEASFQVADMRKLKEIPQTKKWPSGFEPEGIVSISTSFGFYDDDTNKEILKKARSLVAAGGFFVLEVMNRDWVVHNQTPYYHSGIDGDRIVLEEREFDPYTSFSYTKRLYLEATENGHYQTEKKLEQKFRLYSLHELSQLFKQAGWSPKLARPGFYAGRGCKKIEKSKRLLVLARKE